MSKMNRASIVAIAAAALSCACSKRPPETLPRRDAEPPVVAEASPPPVLVPQLGHLGGVTSVDASIDGTLIATGGADRVAVVWDARKGVELARFGGHERSVSAVAFSRDGRFLASASGEPSYNGGGAYLWNLETREEAQRVANGSTVHSLAISPNGKLLVTGDVRVEGSSSGFDYKPVATVWDVATGKELQRLPHPAQVSSMAFLPDGNRLVTATGYPHESSEKRAFIWDVRTGATLHELGGYSAERAVVSVSPDGKLVAINDRLFDPDGGREILRFALRWQPRAGAFSRDGKRIAFALGSRVVICDVDGKVVADWAPGWSNISGIGFTSDGQLVVGDE
jgi:WD40 repeat protein